jgi:hypothetical protein
LRIVLLTRYYPPEVSGGARRPATIARAWRELGAEVTVVGPLGIEDSQCIEVLHPSFPATPDIGASRDGANQPIGASLRQALLLPDPEVRWALKATKAASAVAKEANWIVTTSPPESLHLAGKLLKKESSSLWLADLRDLWMASPQLAVRRRPIRRLIETQMAKWILSSCDAISTVSAAVEKEALDLTKHSKPSLIVPHFAEPFTGSAEHLPSGTFNIVHTGSIGLSNPLSKFSSLLLDFEELALNRSEAALWLLGHLSADELRAIEQSSVSEKIHYLGTVSMHRARALQFGADALAIVSGENSHALPGKISEYAQTGLPILISARGPWCSLIPPDVPTMDFADAGALPKAQSMVLRRKGDNIALLEAKRMLDFMSEVQAFKAKSGH